MREQKTALILSLILCLAVVQISEIGMGKAEDTIYIRANGSVLGTDKFRRNGNAYTLTDNIFRSRMIVEKSNIILDGNGHMLSGSSGLYGIHMNNVKDVTIKNITIKNCDNGIFIEDSTHVTVSGNTITETPRSYPPLPMAAIILRHGGSHFIAGNNITSNYVGIYFSSSSNNKIFHNNLIDNHVNVYDPSWYYPQNIPSKNTWDNGTTGNYWSNYNGTDDEGDGIGNTPYVIDQNNQDNYPLLKPVPVNPEITYDENLTTQTSELFSNTLAVATTVIIAIVGVAVLVYFEKFRKTTKKA